MVTIADKPFTSVAKQYETGIKEISCSEGIICEIPVVNNNKTYWNKTCCVGYSVDLLKLLENDLHFIPRVYIVEDGSYGSKTMGEWNGMIGDVYKGKAEIAAAGLTITNLRLKDVQFTSPFMRAPLGILMSNKKDRITFVNFTFLVYMTEQLLWCLLATFFVGIVTVYSYENARSFFALRGQEFNDDDSYKYIWKESFTYFSGLTFQRDLGGKNPKRPAARITAVIFAFTMVIVMTAYTAVLTASNVRQEERDPFKGMQDERVSIVVVVAFTMVIVMTAYTAVLTASNVRQEERDPFKGMQDERVSIVVVVAFTMVIVMTAYTAVLTASNVRQEERDPFKGQIKANAIFLYL